MTIGVYLLRFNNTDKVYVGQSVNIERRYKIHLQRCRVGESSPKLQSAYDTFGNPILEILTKCSANRLDSEEVIAIQKFDSVNNGFNANLGGSHDYYVCSKEQIAVVTKCVELLTNINNTYQDISNITGLAISTVSRIALGQVHNWIESELPEQYSKIVSLREIRRSTRCSSLGVYPILKSPSGILYTIDRGISNFSRTHKISTSSIRLLVRGKKESCKGWTVP
jgi:group I intron endonuclease